MEDEHEMTKTQEQLDAEAIMIEAVERCMIAYGMDKDNILGDFVVLTSVQSLTSDGILVTTYPMFIRNGDLPWYRIRGLLDTHKYMIDQSMGENIGNG